MAVFLAPLAAPIMKAVAGAAVSMAAEQGIKAGINHLSGNDKTEKQPGAEDKSSSSSGPSF